MLYLRDLDGLTDRRGASHECGDQDIKGVIVGDAMFDLVVAQRQPATGVIDDTIRGATALQAVSTLGDSYAKELQQRYGGRVANGEALPPREAPMAGYL